MSRRPDILTCVSVVAAVLLACAAARAAGPDAAGDSFFETKVRPVLAERCYKCHSAAAEKLKGGLRLDSREGLLKGGDGGPAVVPGKPDESRLIAAIAYNDPDLQMPPKGKLPDDQVAVLTEWVKAGAPWPAAPAGPAAVAAKSGFDLQARKAAHWAWQPIRPQQAPAVKDAGWAKGDIDRFVLAKLEEKGLKPAPAADRRVLIRRLYFDLVGLPPSPEEVEAFVNDPSGDATAKVVDRLLASPHFGERWARHWLDLVRYAESRGHEFDYDIPDAWQYRDYVIRAFNADVPYNQFVTEHVAGDLLPEPRRDPTGTINESVIGTGFWHFNEWLHSPVDIREDESTRVDNQVDVFGKAFLGLTIGCARCHDHKFDAISQKDYYALVGFLNSSSFREVRFQYQEQNRAALRRVRELDAAARVKVLEAFAESLRPGLDRTAEYLLAARDVLGGQPAADVAGERHLDRDALQAWADDVNRARGDPSDPLHPWAILACDRDDERSGLATPLARVLADWRAEQDRAASARQQAKVVTVVDYDDLCDGQWIADGLAFDGGPLRPGSVLLGTDPAHPIGSIVTRGIAHSAADGPRLPGLLRTPTFTIASPKLTFRVRGTGAAFIVIDSHRMIAGPLHGVTKQKIQAGGAWRDQTVDLSGYLGQRAHVEFTAAAAKPGDFLAVAGVWQAGHAPDTRPHGNALVSRMLTARPPESAADLAAGYQQLFQEVRQRLAADRLGAGDDAADAAALAEWLVRRARLFVGSASADASTQEGTVNASAKADPTGLTHYQQARSELLAQIKDSPTAMAMLDGNGVDEHVLLRGSHKTPGELVPRRFLEALAGSNQPPIPANTSGRLELARRMTDPSDLLLPRVMVNRVWYHLLGWGIVASVDDFGVMGQPPTHPELLDDLAGRFVRDGWSVKRLIRSIVLSQTYQMSSHGDPAADLADPQNALLHRANLRRLDAEAIRDQMLAVSGRLDPTPYGPSVEVHLTPFMEGRGRPKESGPLDGGGRRSIYTKIRRNFLPPMMLAFDMPGPFNCMGRRTVSNVPAQALTLLNDPFVVEQARLWAERELAAGAMPLGKRITRMYERAFARPPTADELEAAEAFIREQAKAPALADEAAGSDARVWGDFAHVLMNVKEFIFLQ